MSKAGGESGNVNWPTLRRTTNTAATSSSKPSSQMAIHESRVGLTIETRDEGRTESRHQMAGSQTSGFARPPK